MKRNGRAQYHVFKLTNEDTATPDPMAHAVKRHLRAQRITILRGGLEITFHGYLDDKTCPICKKRWPAASFLKELKYEDGRRYLVFGQTCQCCEMPIKPFPTDLHGARLKDSFVDDAGRRGWFQRNKAGTFGPELPLSRMTLRQTADGVWRPQPKLDRRRAELIGG